jgi:beta-N-acetylhexosaminidase
MALMHRAWARGLTALDGAKPPPLDRPVRVVTQREVPSDGISEAGLPGERVAALFARFADAEVVQVDDLRRVETLPRDSRATILVSNIRERYAGAMHWPPALHLVLWNPFQALDFRVPSIVSWGYGEGALAALRAWLEGRAEAPGRSPVPLR